jgi:hypothetical protein
MTRVWYFYGHAADAHSIDIGHTRYAERLVDLEDHRHAAMDKWCDWNTSYSGYEIHPLGHIYQMVSIDSCYDPILPRSVNIRGDVAANR